MGKFYGRLPDGKETNNARAYVRAWRKFAAPVGKALGGELCAFDPRVSYLVDGTVVQLSAFVVERLNRALNPSPAKGEPK